MADTKISNLNEIITPAANDVFPIVDTSAVETKKITYTNLEGSIDLDNITEGTTNKFFTATEKTKLSTAGDVIGPATAVDNAISTFDTTTGKLLQDSGLIAESGKIYESGYPTSYIKFNSGTIEIWAGGVKQISWN